MKIKIFLNDNADDLEQKVNQWLAEKANSISVTNILQSEAPGDEENVWNLTITVVYIEVN